MGGGGANFLILVYRAGGPTPKSCLEQIGLQVQRLEGLDAEERRVRVPPLDLDVIFVLDQSLPKRYSKL